MLYIVVLNWNGTDDTIECIKSILANDYTDYKIIIIDNYSQSDFINCLSDFIESINDNRIVLIKENQNWGFAQGCNIGIDYAIKNIDCKYIWLLNNDTEILSDTISKLVCFMDNNPSYSIVTPQINYFDKKSLIWNCGGTISKFGFRKYYFASQDESVLPKNKILNISFVTNCASFFRKEFFDDFRFSKDFFFGEDDFIMCLYALKHRVKIACILNTKIYHKVNSSIKKQSYVNENRIFVHYLNRFISMKLFYNNKLIFFFYKSFYLIYIKELLKSKVDKLSDFINYLKLAISKYNSVDKQTFETIMHYGYKKIFEENNSI